MVLDQKSIYQGKITFSLNVSLLDNINKQEEKYD